MKKIFVILIVIIFSVAIFIYIKSDINNVKISNNSFNIELCGEVYSVEGFDYVNENIVKSIIEGTIRAGNDLCGNPKNDSNNFLKIIHDKKYPKLIVLIFRDVRYEYDIKDDGIYLNNDYDNTLYRVMEF